MAAALAGCGAAAAPGLHAAPLVCVQGAKRNSVNGKYYTIMACVDARDIDALERDAERNQAPPTPPGTEHAPKDTI